MDSAKKKAKRYLLEVKILRRQIQNLEQKREFIRTTAEGMKAITYDRDKIITSPVNSTEKLILELVEITNQYSEKILEYHKAIEIRRQQVMKMAPQHAEVLTLLYLDGPGLGLWGAAKIMSLSYDTVKHLHTNALKAFAKAYLEDVE